MSDDQSTDPTTDEPDDDGEPTLTVSEAGSSFSGAETSAGGADAVPSTPDSVPRVNREDNEYVEDDSPLA